MEPCYLRCLHQDGHGIIDEDEITMIGDPSTEIIYDINANMGSKGFDFSLFFLCK